MSGNPTFGHAVTPRTFDSVKTEANFVVLNLENNSGEAWATKPAFTLEDILEYFLSRDVKLSDLKKIKLSKDVSGNLVLRFDRKIKRRKKSVATICKSDEVATLKQKQKEAEAGMKKVKEFLAGSKDE